MARGPADKRCLSLMYVLATDVYNVGNILSKLI